MKPTEKRPVNEKQLGRVLADSIISLKQVTLAPICMHIYEVYYYLLKAEKGRGFSLSYWQTRPSLALSPKKT